MKTRHTVAFSFAIALVVGLTGSAQAGLIAYWDFDSAAGDTIIYV